jgi:hypothetical protein
MKTSQYTKTHISFVTGKLIVYLDSSCCIFCFAVCAPLVERTLDACDHIIILMKSGLKRAHFYIEVQIRLVLYSVTLPTSLKLTKQHSHVLKTCKYISGM